ncbi:MAG TPA: cellulose biosynthesis protein BcsQ [Stellaceae bacterium]|jgi:cellulose synthase operon protein YhjQ|nr:cellulose biosynthesis protein BcsQ [Stellaceae bacterium]
MPVICFTSPKGGVGRTTLAATVAVALRRLGWRVLAIDLDRQNALRLNFELPEELRGVADELDSGRAWSELAVDTPAGIQLVPFGAVAASDALRLHTHIGQNAGWLRQRLTALAEPRDRIVIVDMPPGPSPFNVELDGLADLHIVPLLADAMSLALLPKLQRGDLLLTGGGRVPQIGFVINQVDPRRQLCRDVLALSRDVLGDALYGMVHQDEGVAEAAACQLTVLDYAPESVASRDIMMIAQRVHASLAPV